MNEEPGAAARTADTATPSTPGAATPRTATSGTATSGTATSGTATSGTATPGTATPSHAGGTRPAPVGVALAPAALLWLGAMLWAARATITVPQAAEMEVTATAYALPGATSASLTAGAAVAVAVLGQLARGGRTVSPTVRLAVATGAGLVTGLLAALPIVTINAAGWLYLVVAGTIAAAATMGGAVGGIRLPAVVTAGCWAALTVFALSLGLNLFQEPLLGLLGAGQTQASQAGAVGWFATCTSVLGGLAAGVVSYAVLRRAARRSGAVPVWPLYALAGAGPGLLLILTEVLTRTAGARVLDLAGRVSDLELAAQDMLGGARLNNALIVLFVGAVTAIIAVGRTMGAAPDDAPIDDAPIDDAPIDDAPIDDAPIDDATDGATTEHFPSDREATSRD